MSSRAEGQNIYISTLCIQYTYMSVTCILSVDSVDISTHWKKHTQRYATIDTWAQRDV